MKTAQNEDGQSGKNQGECFLLSLEQIIGSLYAFDDHFLSQDDPVLHCENDFFSLTLTDKSEPVS